MAVRTKSQIVEKTQNAKKAYDFPFKLSHIDTDKGLDILNGNSRAYAKFLKKFANKNSGSFEKMQELLSSEDFDSLGYFVHAMKSASGNLGMMALYEILVLVSKRH